MLGMTPRFYGMCLSMIDSTSISCVDRYDSFVFACVLIPELKGLIPFADMDANSSAAYPSTLFILYDEPGLFE